MQVSQPASLPCRSEICWAISPELSDTSRGFGAAQIGLSVASAQLSRRVSRIIRFTRPGSAASAGPATALRGEPAANPSGTLRLTIQSRGTIIVPIMVPLSQALGLKLFERLGLLNSFRQWLTSLLCPSSPFFLVSQASSPAASHITAVGSTGPNISLRRRAAGVAPASSPRFARPQRSLLRCLCVLAPVSFA